MSARIGAAVAAAAAADGDQQVYCSTDDSIASDDAGNRRSLDDSDTGTEQHSNGGGNSSNEHRETQSQQQCKRRRGAEPGSNSRAGSKQRRNGSSSSAAVLAAPCISAGRNPAVELPGGIWRVDGLVQTFSTSKIACGYLAPLVPGTLAAKCFPGPQQPGQRQPVQLSFTVDGTDSTPAAGAISALRCHPSHTITGMSASRGSTQLTLHLQSPAGVAAAQQAADAAAAAVEATPAAWHQHQLPHGKELAKHNRGQLLCVVPRSLLSSAFDGAWQQRGFKVQLSVHKDGACIAGGAGARRMVSLVCRNNSFIVYLPTACCPSLLGCHLTEIKAAAPNLMQAHVTSSTDKHSGALPAAATAPGAAATNGLQPHQSADVDHASRAAQTAMSDGAAALLSPVALLPGGASAPSCAAQPVASDPAAAATTAVPVTPAESSITPGAPADAAGPPVPAAAPTAAAAPNPAARSSAAATPAATPSPAAHSTATTPPPAPPPPPAAAASAAGFTLAPFAPADVAGALAGLVSLLGAMSAADELVGRLDTAMDVLLDLPQGHAQLQRFRARYASVQLWAGRGRFDKAAGVIDAMLGGLGV